MVKRIASPLIKREYKHASFFWETHPDKLAYLKEWYPSLGLAVCADLGVSATSVHDKAYQLGLKVLPRKQRVCVDCRTSTVGHKRAHGLRCERCWQKHIVGREHSRILDAPLARRMHHIIRSLRHRHPDATLTTADLVSLWESQHGLCAYTERPMIAVAEVGLSRHPDAMSVDRIDSSQGYHMSNVVLCTWWANAAKNDRSVADFIERCRDVVRKADGDDQHEHASRESSSL